MSEERRQSNKCTSGLGESEPKQDASETTVQVLLVIISVKNVRKRGVVRHTILIVPSHELDANVSFETKFHVTA